MNKIILIPEKLFSTIIDLEEAGLTTPTEDQLCSETDVQLTEFRRVSEKDIVYTVIKSPTKHCDLNPIPTSLLKDMLKSIVQLLQEITNKLMTSGAFPQDFKETLVNPLIKKILLDHLSKKNYCPVSNLSFGSKCVEKVVAAQLVSYLDTYNLMEQTNQHTEPTIVHRLHYSIQI